MLCPKANFGWPIGLIYSRLVVIHFKERYTRVAIVFLAPLGNVVAGKDLVGPPQGACVFVECPQVPFSEFQDQAFLEIVPGQGPVLWDS